MSGDYKFKKGDLVQLNEKICRTGRSLHMQKATTYTARRPTTQAEQQAWYQTDAAKGMNDAGESKLPPQSTAVPLEFGRPYEVVRARCQIRLGWGNPTPGLIAVQCMQSGDIGYLKRRLVQPYAFELE
jgi:hypothetical protein